MKKKKMTTITEAAKTTTAEKAAEKDPAAAEAEVVHQRATWTMMGHSGTEGGAEDRPLSPH
jgi:hypothetical protein